MQPLLTLSDTQQLLKEHLKARRLQKGLTQEGLAKRAGISLPTLQKYEQKGRTTLDTFLKLLMVLGGLRGVLDALKPIDHNYLSMADVLSDKQRPKRKRGWRK